VQRYERQIGLPIRRPHGQGSGVVFAFSDEVDVWMRSHFESGRESEVEVLRKKLAETKKQNKLLRAKLELAERAVTFIHLKGTSDLGALMDEMWRIRGSHAIERSNAIRLQSAELREVARALKEVIETQGKQAWKLSQPSFVN
jgi:hypothetical protein